MINNKFWEKAAVSTAPGTVHCVSSIDRVAERLEYLTLEAMT